MCVWAAAKGGTEVKKGGFKWALLSIQKMQRSLKGSMLKWVAYVLIFKDRRRRKRLYLSAFISSASHNTILGGLTTDTCFSYFWRLGSPRSRCQQTWFSVRAFFLACTRPPPHYVLT